MRTFRVYAIGWFGYSLLIVFPVLWGAGAVVVWSRDADLVPLMISVIVIPACLVALWLLPTSISVGSSELLVHYLMRTQRITLDDLINVHVWAPSQYAMPYAALRHKGGSVYLLETFYGHRQWKELVVALQELLPVHSSTRSS